MAALTSRQGDDVVEHLHERVVEDGDVIVFATGKSYVKVRYTQRTEEG